MNELVRSLRPADECPVTEARGLLAFWHALARRGTWPDWQAVDKITLKPWMGWLVVYDVVDGGADFRYRLVGAEIVDRAGIDHTGKFVSESAFADDNNVFLSTLRDLQAAGAPRWIDQPISTRRGMSMVYDRLCLPFANGGDDLGLWLFYVCGAEALVDRYTRDPVTPSGTAPRSG